MRLVRASGPLEGSAVEIDGGQLTIGRVPDNDLQLAHETVSRQHAVIEVQPDARVVLRDLGSRNGTFVDGLRLSGAYALRGGERLRFGDEQLLVGAVGQAQPPAAPPESRAAAEPAERAPGRGWRAARALRRPRRLAVLALAVLAALVFGVGQLVLPGVAEQRLRSQLARNGTVRLVKIESVPAVKLLWHRADSVRVAMDGYRSNPTGPRGSLADFLSRTRDTAKLDVSVATLQSKLVTLRNVSLRKTGDQLVGRAELTQANLTAALPSYLNLRPLSASAEGIELAATASLLGQHASIRLEVQASSGHIVVRPQGLPFGSLATITVFGDPRIYVESLEAELHGERYALTARARLR